MEPVGPNDETLIQYDICYAVRAGFDRIVIVVNRGIRNTLELNLMTAGLYGLPCVIQTVVQDTPANFLISREKPLGSVCAVTSARRIIQDDPFAVINCDDYYAPAVFDILSRSLDHLNPASGVVITYPLSNVLNEECPANRGLCLVSNGHLRSILEVRGLVKHSDGRICYSDGTECSPHEASMNVFAFGPGAMSLFEKYLERFLRALRKGDESSECILSTAVNSLMHSNELCMFSTLVNYPWAGLTYPSDVEKVRNLLS